MSGSGASEGRRLAFLLEHLTLGGAQRMTLALAREYVERGYLVDLLAFRPSGPLLGAVPAGVRLVSLPADRGLAARLLPLRAELADLLGFAWPVLLARPHWTLRHLGALVRYLSLARPEGLLTAAPRLNLLAVWARRLAGVRTRVLLSERTVPTPDLRSNAKVGKLVLPGLMRRAYADADAVIAVSNGVADDLAALTGLSRRRVLTVPNPVVGPDLARFASEPVAHPWFGPGEAPVVLSVGRLTVQKDHPTLLRAFASLRARRPVRLVLLGAAASPENAAELHRLAAALGVAPDVDLPGTAMNPFAYMARSAVFALSSAWEGFGNVLVEAMACGCPVVSTDCPSGPAEILEGGRHGPLVPVGDAGALADALARVLDAPPDPAALRRRAGVFTVARAADSYLHALFGGASPSAAGP